MHPIGGATAVNGQFQDGTPTQKGTVVSAEWLNTIQDEIINAIKSAGIQINSQDNDDKKQLANAIISIVQNATANLANKKDLSNLIKMEDVLKNEYVVWLITWVEYMSSKKFPVKPPTSST